jgi:NAD(P)-dependent dehydrogenase (short-subunit alcohol dehydrogenase family)
MPKALVVVVTGSSAGLGRAIAHGFAKRGASVGLIARNPEALNAAKKECEALGGMALVLPTDVSDSGAVEAAARRVEKEFGLIDIWVNDAMVSVFSPVKEMEASDYRSLLRPPLILSEFPTVCWASRASKRRSLWPFLPGAIRQRRSCWAQS